MASSMWNFKMVNGVRLVFVGSFISDQLFLLVNFPFNSFHLKIRQLSDDSCQILVTKVESSFKTPHFDRGKYIFKLGSCSNSYGYELGVESLCSEHSLLKPYCSRPGDISSCRNGCDWYSILKNIIAFAGPLQVLVLGITTSAMSGALQDYSHCTKI